MSPDDPLGLELPARAEIELAGSAPVPPAEGQSRLALKLPDKGIWLYEADTFDMLARVAARWPDGVFDMIFADPPYFLSNGGITCHAGRMVSVNKGKWDVSRGAEENHAFNKRWLELCQRVLKPDGTIWVSGTSHVIHSVGFAMQQLGFKLLNDITWVKPNPPPNLSCRYFTHSTETIIWAAKNKKSRHEFDYKLMRQYAGGRQMRTVWLSPLSALERGDGDLTVEDMWEIQAPLRPEKEYGKHPAQKPVSLLLRIIEASTSRGALVLDPFMGSGTTGVAAVRLGRRFIGIEQEVSFVRIAKTRIEDGIRRSTPEVVREAAATYGRPPLPESRPPLGERDQLDLFSVRGFPKRRLRGPRK